MGQRWAQGLIGPDDRDPKMLLWGIRGQICPGGIPAQGFVIRFDFWGIPQPSMVMLDHNNCRIGYD